MIDSGWGPLAALWEANPGATAAAGVVLALLLLALLAVGIIRLVRGTRSAPPNVKLQVGNFVVQAGVTWAVVTGTQAYCAHVLKLPEWEAWAYAVILEAATWATIGRVIAYGRSRTAAGEPTTGMGPAAPAFWLFSVLGGSLAVAGADSAGAGLGRAVIVTFGTYLWHLTLQTYTRPSGAPSRFRWTPRRLLVAVGAIEPADQDIADDHHEWQTRRLARAMRWSNSRPPMRWLGQHALTARAEQTSEAVIEAARRRYAVTHLLRNSVQAGSDVMRRVIDAVETEVTGAGAELERRRAELAAGQKLLMVAVAAQHAQLEQQVAAFRAQLAQDRAAHLEQLAQDRTELDAYRERLEQQRVELDMRRRAIATRTAAPAGSGSGTSAGADTRQTMPADVELLDKVIDAVRKAITNREPYGQRPIAAAVGVSRARVAVPLEAAKELLGIEVTAMPEAKELIEAAREHLAIEALAAPAEFPHVNGARTHDLT